MKHQVSGKSLVSEVHPCKDDKKAKKICMYLHIILRRVLNKDCWKTAESYKQNSIKLRVSHNSWSLSKSAYVFLPINFEEISCLKHWILYFLITFSYLPDTSSTYWFVKLLISHNDFSSIHKTKPSHDPVFWPLKLDEHIVDQSK